MPTRHARSSLLRPLGAVLRTALTTVLDTLGVEGAANDVIANARKVLHTAAPDHDDRVLLPVVPLAGTVANDLEPVGDAHARHLANRLDRLHRRRRVDAGAHTPLLPTRVNRRNRVPLPRHLSTLP